MRMQDFGSGPSCNILCTRYPSRLASPMSSDMLVIFICFVSMLVIQSEVHKRVGLKFIDKFTQLSGLVYNTLSIYPFDNITQNILPQPVPSMQQNQESLAGSRLSLANNGLKQYVVTANQCDHMRKRIKILAQLQTHNQARVRQQQKSLQKIESLRLDKQHQGSQKEDLNKKRKQEQEQLRLQSKRMKTENKSKIKQVLREIQQEKMDDRNKIKEQSLHIARKINENKEKQLQEKKEKRNRVVKIEQECKQNYNSFFLRKREDLALKNQMELTWFGEKRREKDQQMMVMSTVETDLLSKHSQTIKQYDNMKAKLGLIYKTPVVKRSLGKIVSQKPSQHSPFSPIINKKQVIESL